VPVHVNKCILRTLPRRFTDPLLNDLRRVVRSAFPGSFAESQRMSIPFLLRRARWGHDPFRSQIDAHVTSRSCRIKVV